ncbi:hypothetical protein HHE03_18410 [Helicobacter heilmannii]|uniref:hypothetical protein n=1 Tax=Helicobacter heilmannii TaxID=35817 RepID=UPI0006A0124C|nr:hypothetical protein [Helicobacter heilmannii]CRF50137.1 hypothetical protein HHE03_18410 [Helicobacter heilmannii]
MDLQDTLIKVSLLKQSSKDGIAKLAAHLVQAEEQYFYALSHAPDEPQEGLEEFVEFAKMAKQAWLEEVRTLKQIIYTIRSKMGLTCPILQEPTGAQQ